MTSTRKTDEERRALQVGTQTDSHGEDGKKEKGSQKENEQLFQGIKR